MREIKLTRGKTAIVDDCDYEELSKFKWHAIKCYNTWYAKRCGWEKPRRFNILMHRQIMSPITGHIDHKNGDGLDNRRENLREATRSLNMRNRVGFGKSKYPGVAIYNGGRCNKKWRASITVNGKKEFLGGFVTEYEAYLAYIAACKKYGFDAWIRPLDQSLSAITN